MTSAESAFIDESESISRTVVEAVLLFPAIDE
jgi:hypothetical protein